MGFADRLEQARAAQEKQSGPIAAADGNRMIVNALTHAVETNRLQQLYTPQKIASQARSLSQLLDFDPFCQKYGIAPLIAADLLQLSLYDVVVFIDDSGSMLEGSKWRDLQAIVQQIVEITTQFDTDGIQIEFMNSSVRADNVASPADLHNIFSRVRPMGFTPLASALESKVLDPYYEMLRATPAANVKPMVIYVCTDGAPTTERGLKTYQPTFTMLGKMDSTLQSLGLPRKTIGINVTQIGLDDGASEFLQTLDDHPHFGDRIDCVSDFEVEMTQCQAQGVYLTPDMYIVKLLVGCIDDRYDAQDSATDDVQPVANRGNAPNLSIGAAASPQRLPLLVRTPSSDSGLLTKPSLPSAGSYSGSGAVVPPIRAPLQRNNSSLSAVPTQRSRFSAQEDTDSDFSD